MNVKPYCVVIIGLILVTTGCSLERNLRLDPVLPVSPVVKQIPLGIGVYYSPEFIKYSKKIELIGCGPSGRRDRSGIFFIFPVGSASRDLFDQIITNMFTTVTITSQLSQSSDSVSGIIEPRIESFDWNTSCSEDYFSNLKLVAKVSYVINLYDSVDDHLVASLRVNGRGAEKPKSCFHNCKDSIATEQAMQDAMAEFMIDFQEQPEVKSWLSSHISALGTDQ